MLSFEEFKKKRREEEQSSEKQQETTPWGQLSQQTGQRGYKAWRDWKGNVNLSNLSTGEVERKYQAYNHVGGADSNRAPTKDNLLSDIGQSVGGALQRQGASYKGAGANLLLSMADLFNGKEEFKPQVGSALWRMQQGAQADMGVANKLVEDSKYGHGKAYGLVMDLTSGAVDLASDALLTAATGGASIGGKLAITAGLGAMGARSFGSGAMEAEQAGKSRGQQFLSGLKSASIEILTEKLGGFDKIYGSTFLGDLTGGLTSRLSSNAGMKFVLDRLKSAGEEGAEEMLSDVLNPLADKILKLDNGEGWQNLWTKEGLSQMAYDGLVGGLLGMFGSSQEGKTGPAMEQAISDSMDNAMAASQQGRSIGAELENDKDGLIAKAVSNTAAQEPQNAHGQPIQQTTPEAAEVAEKAPPVEFNAKTEAEAATTPDTIVEAAPQMAPVESPVEGGQKTKPIGKKTARDVAFDAWFADNAKNTEQNGVEVDASDFTDENAEPSTKEPESAKLEGKQKQTNEERIAKSRESALAQNGIDYGYDPRAGLEIDPDTGTYRDFEPHDLSEEDWQQYKKDLAQARLLDAVDRWLAKNADSFLDAEYGTLDQKHERLQKALNNYVRDQLDQRQAGSEAGEASREVAEARVEDARLKGKQRSQKYTENGYTVVPIGNALYKVTGPGGRTAEVAANSSAEAIQKYNDNLTEESRKAAKERKAKEAELKKMREDVIESGKNPAQVDGSDGNSYEVTKQFSNEQKTRYEYVVTELDEDGLPSDREARVFQNRASTNEEAVQYAIDNDLFKTDDYSDLEEGSNDEEAGEGNLSRPIVPRSTSGKATQNSGEVQHDGEGASGALEGYSDEYLAWRADAERLKRIIEGTETAEEKAARYKDAESFIRGNLKNSSVKIVDDASLTKTQARVRSILQKRTLHPIYFYVGDEASPVNAVCRVDGGIYISSVTKNNFVSCLASGVHELIHSRVLGVYGFDKDGYIAAEYLADAAFSGLDEDVIKDIYSTYADLYFDNFYGKEAQTLSEAFEAFCSDGYFRAYVKHEAMTAYASGSYIANDTSTIDIDAIQASAREALYKNDFEFFSPEDFDFAPLASAVVADNKKVSAIKASYRGSPSRAAGTTNTSDSRLSPASIDNAKEYAYQKKLEAEQNSEEAKEQAQSDEEKAKSTFGKDYGKVQKSAEDFGNIKTDFDTEEFLESDKKRDRSVRNKLKRLREAFSNAAKTGDLESLFGEYEKLADDPDLGNFYNEQVKEEIDNWRKLVDQTSDTYNEPASTYAAARTVRMMAHKFKLANEYQQTLKKMNETLSGSKSGMLRKIAKSEKLTASVARALARWQVNPDTVFKMIDAFDKGNMGEGYKLAKELQTAHREKYKVMQQQRARFSDLDSKYGKDYDDFWRGKQTVKDHNGKDWDMRSALAVVKAIDTIRSTSGKKLGGTDGFGVQKANGDIEFIDMKDTDAIKLYESLKSGLSDVAMAFGDAATEAFGDVKEPLRKKFFENNGVEVGMVGDNENSISENAKGKTGYEKAVYSPLSYVAKNGQVYQFDIAKQDTYNNVPRFLRERSDEGGTYILIKPYTDVVDGYFEQVSNYLAYSAYGEKMRGLGRGSSYTPGLATSLADAFGKDMGNWYQNYVEDLKTYKNEEDTEGVNSLLRQGRQKLQQGALLFSVSVPMKQISSYWAASGILHPDSLIKNYRVKLLKPKNSSDAATMLASRAIGNLEQSASEAAKDAEKWLGKLKYSSKFIKFAANAINQMDYNTVSNLLSATEYDVLKYQFNNDKSKVGTEEYNAAVEELFQEVVDRSQPNFDKQMRAEYGRTDNEIIRMLSMFRTQQTQNLNLLATAIGEYRAAKGTDNQAKATETLKQTIAGQAASAFSLSVLTILADMLLHRQKKYEDDDKEIDPTKVMSRLGINAIEAASGTLWFGDTVAKWTIDQLSGGETNEFYGLNLGVVTTLPDVTLFKFNCEETLLRMDVDHMASEAWHVIKKCYWQVDFVTNFHAVNVWASNPLHGSSSFHSTCSCSVSF